MDAAEINQQKVMQLATQKDGQPWICTLYFVLRSGNFYWLSYPERRHSLELLEDSRAAVVVTIKQDLPVIGLQCEGEAAEVDDLEEIEGVMADYVEKYGGGRQFVQRYKDGKNHHVLYRLRPARAILFDELNSPENPQKEVDLRFR